MNIRLSSLIRKRLAFYLFISPWLIGLLVFTLGPFVASFLLGFTQSTVLGIEKWIGLQNYRNLIEDPLFWQSLKVTVIYSLGSVPLLLIIGFAIALLMNQKVKGIFIFRTIYYLPSVVSGVAVSLLWVWIFNPRIGLINRFLGFFGIEGPMWLFDQFWVLPAFIVMSLWGVGGSMIIYLAGLQGIPTELYEAAEIDGAGIFNQFKNVTLPLMTPIIFFNLVMGVIGSFQVFTQAFVMTNGGPGNASLFYVLYIYRQAFQFGHLGFGSALAWVLFLIILIMTLIVIRSSPYWVYYETLAR